MKVKSLKLTGIQYVTISMLGTTTDGEPETHRRQDNVFVCVRDTVLTVWSAASVSESELQATEKTIWCTTQPTKSSKVCRSMYLRSLRYPINFPLQYYVAIALALWRGGVQRLGRAGIGRFCPRGGHLNKPFRG